MTPAPHLLATVLLLTASACGRPESAFDPEAGAVEARAPLDATSLDRPETIDVGSWNIEWLGANDRGPSDEALQLENAAVVLGQVDLDLVGLVEVVSEESFTSLMESLPGFHGLLVTDPRVEGGRDTYGDDEQKVALVMRDRFELTGARVVLREAQWDFGGRPPMEVSLQFEEDGRHRTLDVVVVHFKAMANADGYARRTRAAAALKGWLALEHPRDWALVIGDFNDDLDASTYGARPSPFATFVNDPAYLFTTASLTADEMATTVHFSSTIDHHLATASLARRFVEDSATVIRPDSWVPNFGETTSDHYPVLTRYDLR
jgi:endonuclease/exonuclease/phosphatase family metal-dependent hydrolase